MAEESLFSNKAIRFVMRTAYAGEAPIQNFEQKYYKFMELLNSVPPEFYTKTYPNSEWTVLSIRDPKTAYSQLKRQINAEIRFVWTLTAYKCNKLLPEIINQINKEEIYTAAILLRALMETSAIGFYSVKKLIPIVREMNKAITVMDYCQLDKAREEITQVFMYGTKQDVFIKNKSNSVKVESLGEYIEFVSKTPNFETFNKQYGHMCDMVHPNGSSNDLFGAITKMYKNEPKVFDKEKVVLMAAEKEKFYKKFEAYDFVMLLINFFGPLISIISMCIDLTSFSIEEGKKLKVKKIDTTTLEQNLARLTNNEIEELINEAKSRSTGQKFEEIDEEFVLSQLDKTKDLKPDGSQVDENKSANQ